MWAASGIVAAGDFSAGRFVPAGGELVLGATAAWRHKADAASKIKHVFIVLVSLILHPIVAAKPDYFSETAGDCDS